VVEQQQIERDNAGFASRDRIDDGGEFGSRQRIAASLCGRVVVDSDDGDDVRCRALSARGDAQIGQRAFDTIEQRNVAVQMAVTKRQRPERG